MSRIDGPRPPDRPSFAGIAAAAAAMQAAVWAVMWVLFGVLKVGYFFFDISDLDYYYERFAVPMSQGQVPFRDFFIEYPPLFVPFMALPGTRVGMGTYISRFSLMMVAITVVACVVVALATFGRRDARRPYLVAAAFAGYTLLLGPIAANRYDAVVALVLALFALLMVRSRWWLAAVALGVGFALKVTPAMLLPLVLLLAPRKRVPAALAGFTVAAVAPFAATLMLGGQAADSITRMFLYHAGRPLEIESILASLYWVGKLLGVVTVRVGAAACSHVIVARGAGHVATFSTLMLLVLLAVTFALVWRRRDAIRSDRSLLFLAVLTTILASLVGSKVLSPQYFVWVVPAAALVAWDRRDVGLLLAGALLLTHIEFPANYLAMAVEQAPWAILIVVVRNLLVVAALVMCLWHLWRIPAGAAGDPAGAE